MQHLIKTVKSLLYTPQTSKKNNNWAVFQGEVCVALLLNNFNVALETLKL